MWLAHRLLPLLAPAPLLMSWPVGPSSCCRESVLHLAPPPPFVFLVDTLPPFSHVPVRLLPRAASEPLANYEFYNLNASNDYTNVSCCLSVFPFLTNFNALCNSFSSAILGFKLMNFSSHPPWLRWILIKSPISVCLNFIYPRLNSKTIPSLQLFLIFVVTSCLFFFSGYYIPVFVLFYAFKIFMLNNS